jgi:hypothetical protein
MRHIHLTIAADEKQYVLHILSMCFQPLVTRCAVRLCPVTLSSVVCLALQYFSTLSHKKHYFWKKVTEYKMCVLIFSTTFVWTISHSKRNWAKYDHKCISVLGVKYLSSLPDLNKINFLDILSKNTQIPDLNKINFLGILSKKYSNTRFK